LARDLIFAFFPQGGTEGSNPAPSSGESVANLSFGARSSPGRKSHQFTSTAAATTYGVNTGVAIWSPSIALRTEIAGVIIGFGQT
jgi:hypothetical protein